MPPQILPFDFGEEAINEGDLTSVQCVVTKGALPVKISWLFMDKPIVSGLNGVSVMQMNKKISTLTIDSINAEHAGQYTCTAKNSAAETSHSAVLNVIGIYD